MILDRRRRMDIVMIARIAIVSTAALLARAEVVFAQESASEVTAAQVAIYQVGLETACRNSGRRRGEAPEQVDAFCTCSMRVLKENASISEWQQAYFYYRKGLKREASDLLEAYRPKLQACKDGL